VVVIAAGSFSQGEEEKTGPSRKTSLSLQEKIKKTGVQDRDRGRGRGVLFRPGGGVFSMEKETKTAYRRPSGAKERKNLHSTERDRDRGKMHCWPK